MAREVDCTPPRDADNRDVHVSHMSLRQDPDWDSQLRLLRTMSPASTAVAERSCGRLGRLIVAFPLRLLVSGSSVPQTMDCRHAPWVGFREIGRGGRFVRPKQRDR